jgi:drug/metabolite transporter (DMT)-like permease
MKNYMSHFKNRDKPLSEPSKGLVLGFLGVLVFSFTLPVTRLIVPFMDPIFLGLGRSVIAGFVAGLILLVLKQPLPTFRQAGLLLLTACGVVWGFPILSALGMQTVPASHGSVVTGLLPLLTVIFATLITKERPSFGFWIVAFIGASLVVGYAILNGEAGRVGLQQGDLYLLGSSIIGGMGYAVGGKISKEIGGWQVICWALVLSFPITTTGAYLLKPDDLFDFPTFVYGAFLYLALASQLFGFFFWNRGLVLGGIARVSQIQLLQPFLSIIAAIMVLGERVDMMTYFFALAVIVTIAIGRKMSVQTGVDKGVYKNE